MGQTTAPLGLNTQQLNEVATATASATGTATFTFRPPALGEVWSGTLSVPNAPPVAALIASTGTQQWAQWAGSATAGPVQLFVQQTMKVVATGLLPFETYQVTLIGTRDTDGLPAPLWPDPTTSSAITVAGPQPIFSNPQTGLLSGIPLLVDVPNGVRTLILQITNDNNVDTVTNVEVQGGFVLYNQPPYLFSNGAFNNGCLIVVPLPVTVTIATITVTTSAGNFGLIVNGDTTLYDESVFYNGVIQQASHSGAGTGTLLTGPARLLTAWGNAPTGDSVVIQNSAGPVAVLVTSVGTTATTFPDNTILASGQTLQYNITGGGQAGVTWAYP